MPCPLLSNSLRKGQRMMLYSCSQMVGLPAHMYLCSINWYCFVLFDSFFFPLSSSFLGYKECLSDDRDGVYLLKPLPGLVEVNGDSRPSKVTTNRHTLLSLY